MPLGDQLLILIDIVIYRWQHNISGFLHTNGNSILMVTKAFKGSKLHYKLLPLFRLYVKYVPWYAEDD